jgi:hypothetical protein
LLTQNLALEIGGVGHGLIASFRQSTSSGGNAMEAADFTLAV